MRQSTQSPIIHARKTSHNAKLKGRELWKSPADTATLAQSGPEITRIADNSFLSFLDALGRAIELWRKVA